MKSRVDGSCCVGLIPYALRGCEYKRKVIGRDRSKARQRVRILCEIVSARLEASIRLESVSTSRKVCAEKERESLHVDAEIVRWTEHRVHEIGTLTFVSLTLT